VATLDRFPFSAIAGLDLGQLGEIAVEAGWCADYQEPAIAGPGVPEAVRNPGREHGAPALLEHDGAIAAAKLKAPLENVEDLLDRFVHMEAGVETGRDVKFHGTARSGSARWDHHPDGRFTAANQRSLVPSGQEPLEPFVSHGR
jgi:hypothetical protein